MAERPVVLVGLMGSGKSTLGPTLARALARRFVDLDRDIEEHAGSSVAEIFEREGEPGFRRREAERLGAVLAEPDGPVVATGGGVVVDQGNRARLAGVPCVWLRATARTLAGRVGDGNGRPLLEDGDVLGRLTELVAERGPLYEEVADVVVDVDGRRRPDVVAEILRGLAALGVAA